MGWTRYFPFSSYFTSFFFLLVYSSQKSIQNWLELGKLAGMEKLDAQIWKNEKFNEQNQWNGNNYTVSSYNPSSGWGRGHNSRPCRTVCRWATKAIYCAESMLRMRAEERLNPWCIIPSICWNVGIISRLKLNFLFFNPKPFHFWANTKLDMVHFTQKTQQTDDSLTISWASNLRSPRPRVGLVPLEFEILSSNPLENLLESK